jgi:2-polyprenyl-3-methyl-5-hydroxy-6-metoxy-1,4-benzoquinol methylase
MTSLQTRCRRPEQMDQPDLDQGKHFAALAGLGRINRLSRSDAILWPSIAPLARDSRIQGRPLRVLDVACGGGDVAIALALRGARAGLDLQVEGCDISPRAVGFACRQAESRGVSVRFFALDALHQDLPADYDVVCCSLFLHHLDETDAVELLRRMAAAARRRVLVNDLIRGRRGYLLAWAGCRLLSRSPVVHEDGPTSVAAAFSIGEALSLAGRAGLGDAILTRHWPQRFLLSWSRR